MKQFYTILAFELKYYFKNKVFVGVTVFLVALIAVVMFFPRLTALFVDGDTPDTPDTEERSVMLISTGLSESVDYLQQSFAAAFPDYNVLITNESLDTVKEQIISEDAECAFVIDSLTSYTYYVNNLSMYDANTAIADEILQSIFRMNAMISGGIPADEAQHILTAQIEHETASLGKDQMQTFFYAYIMVFALYMVILLYGQMVATNVATEKSSRAMELLVTSAKPTSMMFGKVIASCLAGLIQLVAVFGSALLFFNINKTYWDGNAIITSIFDMNVDLLIYLLIFFVLGFFIYAFMYGAIGSTASKVEDINTSIMPITLLFIIGFSVVMFSMASGDVDNMPMKVCSFIPFTSPMAMFTRISMSTVPFHEIVISIAILVLSVLGIGVLSAKIYRVGVLLYGTAPKIGAVLKMIRKA